MSDIHRTFRELWAISSRSDAIRNHMADYFRTFSTQIAEFVLGKAAEEDRCDRLASVLMPFFEGYCVTANAVPLPKDEVADMLTDIVMSAVRHP
ncbi:MAG: hypothetical protein AAFN44_09655 [Pseudomonadota bacterium]